MDSSFCAKFETLNRMHCIPIRSFSFHSFPSSSRICSLQRDFFGCCHRLRPPGIRSRRNCKKLGFQNQSSRFLIRASLYSGPILVIVAVATVSALTVVYLNYFRRKKDFTEGIESPNSGLGKLNEENLTEERKDSTEENVEDILSSGVKEVQLSESQNSASTLEGSHLTEASESPISEIITSRGSAVSTKETEDVALSSHPLLLEESAVTEPVTLTIDMPQFLSKGRQQEDVLDSELPRLVEPFPRAFAIPVNYAHVKIKKDHSRNHEVGEEEKIQMESYDSSRSSVREELYKFYEENQAGVGSISNFNSVTPLSSHISFPNINSFSSLARIRSQDEVELSVGDSRNTTGDLDGKNSIACYKEVSSGKKNDSGRSREFPRDTEKRQFPQNGYGVFYQSPQPSGVHVSSKHDSSWYFNSYNRLLRDGRLVDCIELLEDMDRKGLLDMNNIYHARFFKACKSLKAVQEAFHFTKLIANPTLSTFNMLLSVCANSQDAEGAFQVLQLVKKAGLKADCKLYTTLISTCAKSGKVDAMFKVFHEMVNAGVEPNNHTYGALIDGCARAGQVPKAFGAYGIMRSKNVKPDRVIFNALITACGQSGAVDRAFDVLAEMSSEPQPIDPDHVTVGALIKTCAQAGQIDRAREVYKMIHQYNIKGTPELYTIAVNSCSQIGDLEFALSVYGDMTRNGVIPDEMFLSAIIDVAGHAENAEVAFEILQDAKVKGLQLGNISYSSLMGACSNAKNWQKALELYEDIKSIKLCPTVSTMNALITALCHGDQLQKAVEVLAEMKKAGVCPNSITYSILLVASDKKDELELGFMLLSQAKKDGVAPNAVICRCLTGMCLRRFEKACSLGEPVLSFDSGKPEIDNKWTSLALSIYRETIVAGIIPTMEVFSQVLGCLQLPCDTSLRDRLIENLGVSTGSSKCPNIYSLIDGFGEYDPRSFSLLEEAASLGIVPCVSFKGSPIIVDTRQLQFHAAEVYLLTLLKGLKHRLAAGARLPTVTILFSVEKTQILSPKGEKSINLAGRVGQAVGALLRRLRLPYQGNESSGKIRLNGLVVKRWFQPKLTSPFSGKPAELGSSEARLGKGITDQQRDIRTRNLSLDPGSNSIDPNQRN